MSEGDGSPTRVHPNVVRVVEAGRALGLDIEPFHFPDGTKTAADAAAAIGVDDGTEVNVGNTDPLDPADFSAG